MFSVDTAEIRWFSKGEVLPDFSKWFKDIEGSFEEQSERTDIYLRITDESNLGIKLREGRFEVKRLLQTQGILSCKGAEGIANTWRKWSIKADESEDVASFTFEEDHWIKIKKKRLLQRFITNNSRVLIPQSPGPFPLNGIAAELSQVMYNDQKYWTFGIEAFGSHDQILNQLRICFDEIFQKLPPTTILLDHSLSYPEWLYNLNQV